MDQPDDSLFGHDGSRRRAAIDVLDGLNEAQRRAVTHGDGPMLVLAGAGSGKTRVITHRIAHLILDRRIAPSQVSAVTFTNKAASEMRERVEALLGRHGLGSWIGTFHALCLRILRREGSRIGLNSGFTIYDSDDQLALIKRILKQEFGEGIEGTPRSFLGKISRAKNALESPSALDKRAFSPERKLVVRVYALYQDALARANAVDFDDLLVRTLALFDDHGEVAGRYADACRHLLVDEYQDTNRPQYRLIRHLTATHGNICVVGDEDQSIYRFRGAEIRNILDFEADYPGTHTIRLEQNYRSSSTIIRAAGALIANNLNRKGKTLWTENADGEKLELCRAPDDRSEASWVSERVRSLGRGIAFEEIAVLYRTNAQSRQLEEIFRRDRIPYQIVGSVQFYERKEIKDLLGYLKLIANPSDDVSFRRVVNTPPRGIGETTMRVVAEQARALRVPWIEAARHAVEHALVASRSAVRLREFLALTDRLSERSAEQPVAELLESLVRSLDYEAYLEKSYSAQAAERMENVRSLISAAAEYAEESETADLRGFLDRSALVSQADQVGGRPGVTLMTIHCAKGLEFPVVFLIGLEENLFPHAMASGSAEDLEEERRLCYVAMTRARQRLLLSHAQVRRFQGALIPNPPSRFIEEIPADLIRELTPPGESWFPLSRERRAEAYAPSGSSAARAAAARRRSAQTAPRAALQAAPAPEDGFAVGASVRHPRFGGGRILDREGTGRNLKLTIHFVEHGSKKILPAYTKLQLRIG